MGDNGDIHNLIRKTTRRMALLTLDGGERIVLVFKKLRSIDLLKQGTAEILGANLADTARQRQSVELERAYRLEANANDPEALAALQAKWAEEDEAHNAAMVNAIAADLDAVETLSGRMAAWVCASVEAAGYPADQWISQPDSVIAEPIPVEAVCPGGVRPLRFVQRREPGDADALDVADLGDLALMRLGAMIVQATLPSFGEVKPFRDGSRAASSGA